MSEVPATAGRCLLCDSEAQVLARGVCEPCGWNRSASSLEPAGAIHYPDGAHQMLAKLEDSSFWFQHRNRVILSLLRRHPPAGALWDIGGGNGFQARQLQDSGFRVALVDPGVDGCAAARGRGVEHVFCSTLEALALPSGRLAAVSFFDVIEHLERPAGMLSEARRVLRPGGLLYVTVPALNLLWSGADDDAHHFRRYTIGALRDQLLGAGLRLRYATYFFACLLPPVLLLRSLPHALGLSRRGESLDPAVAAREHGGGSAASHLLSLVLDGEFRLLSSMRLPFGTSIAAVAERP